MKHLNNEYAKKMKEINNNHRVDFELVHIEADELLCELLTELGYEDVVNEYKKIGKWYA